MVRNLAFSTGAIVMIAILTSVTMVFAQTATPTSSPTPTSSVMTAPTAVIPSGAPATGRGN